jgi:hypothetical protein
LIHSSHHYGAKIGQECHSLQDTILDHSKWPGRLL